MKSHCIRLFYFLFITFLLTSCKESTDTPPFSLCFDIKLINEDGSSSLKKNRDLTDEITVILLKPINDAAEITDISYLDYHDCLKIQVIEWGAASKNDGNYEQEYIMEIQYPEEIRNNTDTLKIKVQFKNARPLIIEAFYNDKRPKYVGLDVTSFEIENVE